MTSPSNDDELMARVAAAIGDRDPIPDELLSTSKALYISRNLDEELAELLFDSANDRELVLTRGDAERSLSFGTNDLTIELEIDQQAGRIMGMIVPPQVVSVDLEIDGLVVESTDSDDLGRFRLESLGSGPGAVSIVCRSTTTDWGVCIVRFDR
ncbi:MAG: hypothetical protein ACR2P0_07615 [Acidimicrobiales bacterium]